MNISLTKPLTAETKLTARQQQILELIRNAILTTGAPPTRAEIAAELGCAGRIHLASFVQKIHTYRLDAFSSGEAGCCGFIEEGCVRFLSLPCALPLVPLESGAKKIVLSTSGVVWPRIEILMNFAGADGRIVDALVAQGIDGIVVAGTGNGTIHHLLEASLLRAQDRGVAIVVSTRCAEGQVLPLQKRQFLDSAGLNPVKARIALILKLLDR